MNSRARTAHTTHTTLAVIASFLLSASVYSQMPDQQIADAFSLVGKWTITRADVTIASTVSNPNTLPEASLAAVSIDIGNTLGESGHFEVHSDGSIVGAGEAVCRFRVVAERAYDKRHRGAAQRTGRLRRAPSTHSRACTGRV